jgi:hypothetical protein
VSAGKQMRVEKEQDGLFAVYSDSNQLLKGGFPTNASAWRWADDNDEQAINDNERRVRIRTAFAER